MFKFSNTQFFKYSQKASAKYFISKRKKKDKEQKKFSFKKENYINV